jgi:hypothetical protein
MALVQAFGPIALDPCAHPLSAVEADRKIVLPECGLSANWTTRGFTYVNAPFSDLAVWLKKANDEWDAGNIGKLAFLIPASRFDLREYHSRTAQNATTLILRDRLRFGQPEQSRPNNPAPFALGLALWGCEPAEIDCFRAMCPSLVLPPQETGRVELRNDLVG